MFREVSQRTVPVIFVIFDYLSRGYTCIVEGIKNCPGDSSKPVPVILQEALFTLLDFFSRHQILSNENSC